MVHGIWTEFHFGGSILLRKWSVTGVWGYNMFEAIYETLADDPLRGLTVPWDDPPRISDGDMEKKATGGFGVKGGSWFPPIWVNMSYSRHFFWRGTGMRLRLVNEAAR